MTPNSSTFKNAHLKQSELEAYHREVLQQEWETIEATKKQMEDLKKRWVAKWGTPTLWDKFRGKHVALHRYTQKNDLTGWLQAQPLLNDYSQKEIDSIASDLIILVGGAIWQGELHVEFWQKLNERWRGLNNKLGRKNLMSLINSLENEERFEFFACLRMKYSLTQARLSWYHHSTRYFKPAFEFRLDAYDDSQDGELIRAVNPETYEIETYRAINIRTLLEDGTQDQSILGKIYVPNEDSYYPMVYIAWRGSQTRESWLSDTQRTAGLESYLRHEAEVLTQVREAIGEVALKQNRPVNVVTTGHSLGGALSQLSFNSLQRALVRGMGGHTLDESYIESLERNLKGHFPKATLRTHYKNAQSVSINPEWVHSMHVATFNSPGVLKSIEDSSNACSRFLASQPNPIGQHGHFSLAKSDIVQAHGDSHVLTDLEHNQAEVEMLYIDNDKHRNHYFYGALSIPANVVVISGYLLFSSGVLATITPLLFIGVTISMCATACILLGMYLLYRAHTAKTYSGEESFVSQLTERKVFYYNSHHPQGKANIIRTLKDKSKALQCIASILSRIDSLGHRKAIAASAEAHKKYRGTRGLSENRFGLFDAKAEPVLPPVPSTDIKQPETNVPPAA